MIETIKLSVMADEIPDFAFVLNLPLPQGGFLRVRSSGITMLGTLSVNSITARLPGASEPTPLEITRRYDRAEMQKNWEWYMKTRSMAVAACHIPLPVGTSVKVSVVYSPADSRRNDHPSGPAGKERLLSRYSGLSWAMELASVASPGDKNSQPIASESILRLVPGTAARTEVYLKPDGQVLSVSFDDYGNPVAPAKNRAAEFTGKHDGDRAWRVTVREKQRPAMSNAHPAALDGTPIRFGEIHWHTDFSRDGQRALEDALRSARDELCLDFAGPADHMTANGLYSSGRDSAEQAAICRAFDEPGRFCTLPGAELSRRYGHCNLYAESWETFMDIAARMHSDLAPDWAARPNQYPFGPLAELCPEGKALFVPHHANMDSFVREGLVREDGRPLWCAMHFPVPAAAAPDPLINRRITRAARLFEMVQTRGAFETELTDDNWRIFYGGLGGSARTALTRGYRMGFIGGSDNHCGWPTRSVAEYAGLTAVQTEQLDARGIFAALDARRCYATSGARIVADATLNGYPMGAEILLKPGAERMFEIYVAATTPLTAVQIIHCGYVLADLPVAKDSLDFRAVWQDDRPGRPLEDAWYYIRIRQADGHCAWLSPFWVDLAE